MITGCFLQEVLQKATFITLWLSERDSGVSGPPFAEQNFV